MTNLCGWSGCSFPDAESRTILGEMSTTLDVRTTQPLTLLVSPAAALALITHAPRRARFQNTEFCALVAGAPSFAHAALARRGEQDGMAAAFVQGYQEYGTEVLRYLRGRFSVALLRVADGMLLLAVDRFATMPLVYMLVDGCLVFGSSVEAIRRHPRVVLRTDNQGIFDYLYFHMIPGPSTAYHDIYRLPPAGYAIFSQGRLTTGIHWEVRYEDNHSVPFDVRKREFNALLDQAVGRCLGNRTVGCFLSGGTDSSTIAGVYSRVTGSPARTYTIGFDAEGYDEMQYALTASRHFQTEHHQYYVTPQDVVEAVPKVVAAYDDPYGNASAVPTYYCAQLAKADGVETLLAGDGGDELFGGNQRYATQWLFSLYSGVPMPLRRGVIEPLLFAIPGGGRLRLVRKLRSYVQQASMPLPERFETYNLLSRLGPEQVLSQEFLDTVDQERPIRQLRRFYEQVVAHNMLNRLLGLDLKITLADNDLPKVTRMCALAGVEVCFPLLDEDIVAFSTKLPPQLKLKRTHLRYFFKQALQDFLPPETLSKTKHGFGLPIGVWMQDYRPLRELAADSLNDLAARGIVRREFIADLIDKRMREHPHYYGTMVWVLMMLEKWFEHHAGAAGRRQP